MVLSFHPLIRADENLICAGREPGAADLAAMRNARAVILPQGCPQRLYEMAREACCNVFPNYDARFRYAGKCGQIRLFRETGTPHPTAEVFPAVKAFFANRRIETFEPIPCVFKFDWGGEGETVFMVRSRDQLADLLNQAALFEASGQSGFMLQEFIPGGRRSIRVVVIGGRVVSYGRIGDNEASLHSNLARGGKIEPRLDPRMQSAAEGVVRCFCRRTGINLAGLDVIFRREGDPSQPLLLEINYFFGRKGLGGSEAYYRMLEQEVDSWLRSL